MSEQDWDEADEEIYKEPIVPRKETPAHRDAYQFDQFEEEPYGG